MDVHLKFKLKFKLNPSDPMGIRVWIRVITKTHHDFNRVYLDHHQQPQSNQTPQTMIRIPCKIPADPFTQQHY